MSRVGWSLNLPPTLDHLPRSFAIVPSYAVPVRRHMPGWWRGHPGRSCFLVRPSRDRGSSRAHVRTNAARARTCRGGVVSASIRRIQFLKGNHRRPLWGNSTGSRLPSRVPATGSVKRPSPGRGATSEASRNRTFRSLPWNGEARPHGGNSVGVTRSRNPTVAGFGPLLIPQRRFRRLERFSGDGSGRNPDMS
jgi:hypothetical protein